jgi:hypothetical protein
MPCLGYVSAHTLQFTGRLQRQHDHRQVLNGVVETWETSSRNLCGFWGGCGEYVVLMYVRRILSFVQAQSLQQKVSWHGRTLVLYRTHKCQCSAQYLFYNLILVGCVTHRRASRSTSKRKAVLGSSPI